MRVEALLGKVIVRANNEFCKRFLSSLVIYCHPLHSGDWTNKIVNLLYSFVTTIYKKQLYDLFNHIKEEVFEMLENAVQLKNFGTSRTAMSTLRTSLALCPERSEYFLLMIMSSITNLDEPTRLYSMLGLLSEIMRNVINSPRIEELIIQVSSFVEVNDVNKSFLVACCLCNYLVLSHSNTKGETLLAFLENIWDYWIVSSEIEDNFRVCHFFCIIIGNAIINLDIENRKTFLEFMYAKIEGEEHLKSKFCAELLCNVQKYHPGIISDDFKLKISNALVAELYKFESQVNLKHSDITRLESLAELYRSFGADERLPEILRIFSKQPSSNIPPIGGNLIWLLFRQLIPIHYVGVTEGDDTVCDYDTVRNFSMEQLPKNLATAKKIFASLNLEDFSKTRSELAVLQGILKASIIIQVYEYLVTGRFVSDGEESFLPFLKYSETDSPDVQFQKIWALKLLVLWRISDVGEFRLSEIGFNQAANQFRLYPHDKQATTAATPERTRIV